MAKLTMKQITNGMEFILESHDEDCRFCWEKGDDYLYTRLNPPIRSIITVTKAPYKESGVALIDFTIKGDPKEYSANWSIFRNHTTYKSGIVGKKPIIEITSAGPYGGFDIKVKSTHIQDYIDGLGFATNEVDVEFIGTFNGGKKVTTKMINEIKKTAGFSDKLKEILIENLEAKEKQVKEYIKKYDPVKVRGTSYQDIKVQTWYKSGKVTFDIYLTDDFDTVKENVKKQVDYFVKSKKTNLGYLEE